jgi:aldehyde dehydrogenase (NAD+)
MTKPQLELGGKNALVVLDDADLDRAVNIALDGAFFQTGQRCTASSRLVVTKGVHDAFVDRLTQKVAALRVGHALEEGSEIGPVANDAQLAKVLTFLADAVSEGSQLLLGGQRLERPTKGYFVAPALIAGTDNSMRLNQEETFGPIAAVIRVDDLEEAIEVTCDSKFALSSSICTKSLSAAEKFRRSVNTGMVMVNAPTAGVDYHAPFGGRAPSGYGGREQGTAAADFFTEIKTCYVNYADA